MLELVVVTRLVTAAAAVSGHTSVPSLSNRQAETVRHKRELTSLPDGLDTTSINACHNPGKGEFGIRNHLRKYFSPRWRATLADLP